MLEECGNDQDPLYPCMKYILPTNENKNNTLFGPQFSRFLSLTGRLLSYRSKCWMSSVVMVTYLESVVQEERRECKKRSMTKGMSSRRGGEALEEWKMELE